MRHAFGRLSDRELKSISPSHKRLALSCQSLPLLAKCGFLALEVLEPIFKPCAPGLRIGPEGLRERQQCCQFCAQSQRILTPRARHGDAFA